MPIRSTGVRWLAGILLVGFAAIYIAASARLLMASRLSLRGDEQSLAKAARLEPASAEYANILGRVRFFALQDFVGGRHYLKEAVRLNPHNAVYWLDLASLEHASDNKPEMQRAIEAAMAADPFNPDVSWEAANFFLATGQNSRALPLFKVVLNTVDRGELALAAVWQASDGNVDKALSQAIPPTVEAHTAFLQYLLRQKQEESAQKTWQHLLSITHVPLASANEFVDHLIQSGQSERAMAVWNTTAQQDPSGASYVAREGSVLNGGFEEPLLNAGFDWHLSPPSGITAETDPTYFSNGHQSLMISAKGFDGADFGVFQYVAVRPSTEYELSLNMRSEDVHAAQGLRVAVDDAYSKQNLASTDDRLETTPWRPSRVSFHSGTTTHLVVVRLARQAGSGAMEGKVWLDDIALTQK